MARVEMAALVEIVTASPQYMEVWSTKYEGPRRADAGLGSSSSDPGWDQTTSHFALDTSELTALAVDTERWPVPSTRIKPIGSEWNRVAERLRGGEDVTNGFG